MTFIQIYWYCYFTYNQYDRILQIRFTNRFCRTPINSSMLICW